MPYALYVCLQEEDKIAVFAIDAETGRLTPQSEVPTTGGPSVMAGSPDRRTLYIGHRTRPAISSFRISQSTGGLTLLGTVSQEHAPTFLAPDHNGKYLLCAYYQGGGAAVHPLGEDGAASAPSLGWLATAIGAHAIATDPSNRFAFVPHIARLNDNVLEPPKENPGPNMILQFRFDAQSGRLTANSPFRVQPTQRLGPRQGPSLAATAPDNPWLPRRSLPRMRLAQRVRAAERRRSGGRNQRSAEMTLILTGGAWGGGAALISR